MSDQRTEAISHTISVRGIALHYWDWPSDPSPPRVTVLLTHATGFHARLWDAVIRSLPRSWRCVALDLRGHGRSEAPPDDADYLWSEHVADTAAVADALDLKAALGVGHSMGGFVIAGAAARTQKDYRFQALVLVDPSIIDEQDPARRPRIPSTGSAEDEGRPNIADGARRRRPTWESPAVMFASLRPRVPFDTWNEGVLRDYCEYGLLPHDGEGMRLACPPFAEAATFAHTMNTNPWPGLARLGGPVSVMRGLKMHGLPSTTSKRTAGAIPKGEDIPVADCNHFIPMERPDLVVDEIKRLARHLGLPG
jgi:lipase